MHTLHLNNNQALTTGMGIYKQLKMATSSPRESVEIARRELSAAYHLYQKKTVTVAAGSKQQAVAYFRHSKELHTKNEIQHSCPMV